MSLHEMRGLTPHLREVDLTRLEGHIVLGEPLPVLMSAALRVRVVSIRDGSADIAGKVTAEEGEALERAMARVEVPAGLVGGEADAERLVGVLMQTCAAADAVIRRILAQPA